MAGMIIGYLGAVIGADLAFTLVFWIKKRPGICIPSLMIFLLSLRDYFAGLRVKSLMVTPLLPSFNPTWMLFLPCCRSRVTAGLCCHMPTV